MRIISLKKQISVLLVIAATVLAGGTQVQASTPVPDSDEALPTFKEIPNMDLRTTVLNVTKDTDAAMELVIVNSVLNGDVSAVGEVQFRVPPGMTIYGSLLGASGGSGLKIAPFINDPIRPGGTKTWSYYARSQMVGEHEVKAKVRIWPEGNMDAYVEQDLAWIVNVSEPSQKTNTPQQPKAPVAAPTVAPEPTTLPASAPAPQQTTQTKTSSSSGGCSIGGKPDASLLLFGLFVPAIGYLGRRKNKF